MINLFFAVFIFFNIYYVISILKNDFSIVDTAWSLSFLLIYLIGLYNNNFQASFKIIIIGTLTTIWSLRLSGYILYRNIKLGFEDYRYKKMRQGWGDKANQVAYFRVFILQGLLALVIASPLYMIHSYSSNEKFGTLLDWLGLCMSLVGFLWEAIADQQKNKFKSNRNNKDKLCRDGLWKFSRHPNYFGEALFWWGIFVLCVQQIPWYLAIIGPALINFFLLKISGVNLLEKKYEKQSEFHNYKMTTNKFIPWFPKEN